MKNRERVKVVRDWQNALVQERHGRFLAFLVEAELFLIFFLLAHSGLQPLARKLDPTFSFMGVLVHLIVSVVIARISKRYVVRCILNSGTIKLIACLVLSVGWAYLVADIISDEPFKGSRSDQLIGAGISVVASLKIHYGAFSHLED